MYACVYVYDQTVIVVNLMLVKLFGLVGITRHHEGVKR